MSSDTILITGAAGFIGSAVCKKILMENKAVQIIGVDIMNDYYDVQLKSDRLKELTCFNQFIFYQYDIADKITIESIFKNHHIDIVLNLAAQAGVRYSITNPDVYIQSNIIGFFNILECCRHFPVKHLVYASSSSVYGSNEKVPYSTSDQADNPVSLYAATKKSNELLAYSYSSLYGIPSTGLRFFTVYGPCGRPDMAYFSFTKKMIAGETIQIFNNGDMYRDFTYIDDIVNGITKILPVPPKKDKNGTLYKIYNIGNNKPEKLLHFIDVLEKCLFDEKLISETVKKEYLPMQAGDVYQTFADINDLYNDFGFAPSTSLENGLSEFVKWYKEYYL